MLFLLKSMPWWLWCLNIAYTIYILNWAFTAAKKEPFLFRLGCVLSSPGFFFTWMNALISNRKDISEYLPIIDITTITILILSCLSICIGVYQKVNLPDADPLKRKAMAKILKYSIIFISFLLLFAFSMDIFRFIKSL